MTPVTIDRDAPLAALDVFSIVRRRFFQGEATYSEAVTAAEAYRAAIQARKAAEPTRFKRVSVPSVARLMRG